MQADPFEPWIRRWSLSADGEAFETRFGSRLMPVRCDGAAAMLKIAGHPEEVRGGALMDWWAGQGAARVLRREGKAIVLERAQGPRSLSAMALHGADDEATAILCNVAEGLHAPRDRPAPASLVPLPTWFGALEAAAAERAGVYARAWAVARDLLADPRDVVVLHGDFHHDNVLDAGERGWLAIDPKGLIGERGFEYANLFRNPTAELALAPGVLARRADLVSARAGLDRPRLLRWVFAYAVLGAAWSLQSGHDEQPGLRIAESAAAALDT
jgi:streptomycin 6-kinase